MNTSKNKNGLYPKDARPWYHLNLYSFVYKGTTLTHPKTSSIDSNNLLSPTANSLNIFINLLLFLHLLKSNYTKLLLSIQVILEIN